MIMVVYFNKKGVKPLSENMNLKTGTQNFTLIELLVVIAIIGFLASMILPSLSKARESAVSYVCLNKLKQIHVAEALFGVNSDGKMVRVFESGGARWWQTLAPFMNYSKKGSGLDIKGGNNSEANIFKCPKVTVAGTLVVNSTANYGYLDFAGKDNTGRNAPVTRTRVSQPQDALMFIDFYKDNFNASVWGVSFDDKRLLHKGRTNTMFVDGHGLSVILLQEIITGVQVPAGSGLHASAYWYQWALYQGDNKQ
ncbi:MAG: type II secretion system protein [Lentisphaeraceae bacterium]|nr:type II secretion system protein [Lentisphaeraceae bacterium]